MGCITGYRLMKKVLKIVSTERGPKFHLYRERWLDCFPNWIELHILYSLRCFQSILKSRLKLIINPGVNKIHILDMKRLEMKWNEVYFALNSLYKMVIIRLGSSIQPTYKRRQYYCSKNSFTLWYFLHYW